MLTVPALSDKGETQTVTLEFTAQAIDSSHNTADITNNITWSINPDDITGVSSSEPQGTNGIFSITVDSTAAKDGEKDVTVTATTSGNKTDTYTFKIKRAESVVTEVKLTQLTPEGSTTVYIPAEGTWCILSYNQTIKDQYGEPMGKQTVNWTIMPESIYVVAHNDGTVRVQKGAETREYTLYASCGNCVGTATFTVSKRPQSTELSIKEGDNTITEPKTVTYGAPDFTLIAVDGNGTGAYSLDTII